MKVPPIRMNSTLARVGGGVGGEWGHGVARVASACTGVQEVRYVGRERYGTVCEARPEPWHLTG